MDIRLPDAQASEDERAAVDAVLGPPQSAWDGGGRNDVRDGFTAVGGRVARARRTLLVPALQALQARIGWVTEGGLAYVCARLSVPPADAWGVATFYAMLATSPRPRRVLHVCDDIACQTRGAGPLIQEIEGRAGGPLGHAPAGDVTLDSGRPAWIRSPCLGLCDQAPAALVTEAGRVPAERLLGSVNADVVLGLLDGGPIPVDALQDDRLPAPLHAQAQLLTRLLAGHLTHLSGYRAAGGYQALARAVALGPEAVIAEVTASKLVGRGGAAFPTGRKWDAVRRQPIRPHYVVCNADESEPGTFKDRVLLTQDPFGIVEAMTIAAYATGSEYGYLYVRAEYPLAAERLSQAIAEAHGAGLLGQNIHGAGFSFDIEIRRGAGAYICGEETALFESIEGKRGEPRSKPPFPVNAGLFGAPTVVNNVETLANVLPIVLQGGAAFAALGTPQSTGTRLFCLSGAVVRPGVYEVPLGLTLRALIERAGGVVEGSTLTAILMGGAAGTFLRPDQLDLVLTHEDTRTAGTTLGSGVVMLFDQTADLPAVVRRIASFFRDESCGQCVPCRVGTVRQEEALDRLRAGRPLGGVQRELQLLDDVGVAMRDASICGLGQTAYAAVESAIKHLGLYDREGAPP